MLYSSFVFSMLLKQLTSTQSITIQNSGFELDLSDYKYDINSYDYGPIQHWEHYDPQNIMKEWSDGLMNPTDGTAFNDPLFGDNAPEGTLVAYLSADELKGKGVIGLHQTLTGNTVTVNTNYTLSVWVGNSAKNTWSKDSKEAGATFDDTGFPAYLVQLVADDIVLAQDDTSLSIPDGQWKQSIITVEILDTNPHIGKTLSIRLLYKDADPSTVLSMEYDDVRLEAFTITSSPTTTATTTTTTMQPSQGTTTSSTATTTVITTADTTIITLSTTSTTSPSRRSSVLPSDNLITSSTSALSPFASLITSTAIHTTHNEEETTAVDKQTTNDGERFIPELSEFTESHELSSNYVDWLAIGLGSVSIAVCCVIMVIVVFFMKERNKYKQQQNGISKEMCGDIENPSTVTQSNIYDTNTRMSDVDTDRHSTITGTEKTNITQDTMKMDKIALGIVFTKGGDVVHKEDVMGTVVANDEEGNNTDSDSEGLWDKGQPETTGSPGNTEMH